MDEDAAVSTGPLVEPEPVAKPVPTPPPPEPEPEFATPVEPTFTEPPTPKKADSPFPDDATPTPRGDVLPLKTGAKWNRMTTDEQRDAVARFNAALQEYQQTVAMVEAIDSAASHDDAIDAYCAYVQSFVSEYDAPPAPAAATMTRIPPPATISQAAPRSEPPMIIVRPGPDCRTTTIRRYPRNGNAGRRPRRPAQRPRPQLRYRRRKPPQPSETPRSPGPVRPPRRHPGLGETPAAGK